MKLIITDAATLSYNNDIDLALFEEFGDVVYYKNIDREELKTAVKDTDIILCNKTEIDREIMECANNLKFVGVFATGYNNIDINCAKEKGIAVCNAGSYSTDAVAQQTFAYILCHYTKLLDYNAFVKSGGWQTSNTFSKLCFPTDELCGKNIGVIGYGSIGKKVSKIANAFGMNVYCYTRTVRDDNTVNFVTFDKLLEVSDIVTVHCPLNEQSKNMFNEKTFSKMKDGAYFVNTARGGVLDEKALFDALQSGKLSGAAIDVLTTEPMRRDCVLKNAKNILITPHTAWAPLSTRKRLMEIVSGNIRSFLGGGNQNRIV
ncbi:MAG: D-2-hydroxyacid dehydrogenase [Clostridia bacterium]|nr:D-2-hydroxyacid dehydrogenase [Clostridia bacterium]